MTNIPNKVSNSFSLMKEDFISLFKDALVLFRTPLNWSIKAWSIIITFFIVFIISIFFVDNNLRIWILPNRNPFFNSVFSIFSSYGKAQSALILSLIFYLAGLLFQKENIRSIGYKIFQLFIYSGLIVTILKSLLGRWRPFNGMGPHYFTPFIIGQNAKLSLSSGDVAVAFSISSVFASLYDNIFWKCFWYFIASITSFGRIYHDQHWLSDVLLSALIAVSIGMWQNHYIRVKDKTVR